jgi:hypothetical protein
LYLGPSVLTVAESTWIGHRADGESMVWIFLVHRVLLGMHLAQLGYRPVPLYNACPSPDTAAVPGLTIVT